MSNNIRLVLNLEQFITFLRAGKISTGIKKDTDKLQDVILRITKKNKFTEVSLTTTNSIIVFKGILNYNKEVSKITCEDDFYIGINCKELLETMLKKCPYASNKIVPSEEFMLEISDDLKKLTITFEDYTSFEMATDTTTSNINFDTYLSAPALRSVDANLDIMQLNKVVSILKEVGIEAINVNQVHKHIMLFQDPFQKIPVKVLLVGVKIS